MRPAKLASGQTSLPLRDPDKAAAKIEKLLAFTKSVGGIGLGRIGGGVVGRKGLEPLTFPM